MAAAPRELTIRPKWSSMRPCRNLPRQIPPRKLFGRSNPLGEALHALRLSGTFFCRSALSAPWGIELPAMPDSLMFHIVTEESAWITFSNGERLRLEENDFALLPQGRGHAIVDALETPAINLYDYDRPLLSPRYEVLTINGGGAKAGLICGWSRSRTPPPVAWWDSFRKSLRCRPRHLATNGCGDPFNS